MRYNCSKIILHKSLKCVIIGLDNEEKTSIIIRFGFELNGRLGKYEEDLTMYNFEYVSKKEAAMAKNELIEIINEVQDILRN